LICIQPVPPPCPVRQAGGKSDAVALSSDTQVKTMEIDRLQKRMAEVSAELDKYTAMYQEAVIDVGQGTVLAGSGGLVVVRPPRAYV